ncbi:MAG: hypothetical protein AAFU64_00875 [Bacteroidota bacterium]
MNKPFAILMLSLLIPLGIRGQQLEKETFDPLQGDQGYYLQIQPLDQDIRAVLLLLPGFGQKADNIFSESKLPYVASVNQMLTIALAGGSTLFLDQEVIQNIHRAMRDIIEKHPQTQKVPWIIGGFSAGGTLALRYAEYSREANHSCPVHIQGVFAVDAPVDLRDLWNYFEREIDKNFAAPGVNEARFVIDLMRKELGEPQDNAAAYQQLSPFDMQRPSGNEKFLQDLPVRVYHDVDIAWQLKNRRRGVRDNNYLCSSEMINRLLLMGNEKAEFIQASYSGYRSNGQRHPHSWSIVDEVACIQWIKGLLETSP